jgi:hypothetical protein
MRVPALLLLLEQIVTGTNLIVVLIPLIALIGIKPKPLRVGQELVYLVRLNGSMLHVVEVLIGSIHGEMNLLLVSVL